MNTTKLKPFAQQARKILMESVRLRMLYWGFDGTNNDAPEPEAIPGGVIFRNEVYNDTSLPGKWQQMKVRINSHTFPDAIEEAAYTWFNRLMAIKILEKNGYEDAQLSYDGTVPALLAKARNGIMPFLGENEKQKVREYLLNGDEENAFGVLLIGYCRRHSLLNRVFGGIDDFTELLLPNNLLTKGGIIELLNINGFVQEEDYKQVELIGWLYQFYISEKKDEVFKGFKENKKARKEDIPAATQIFTPKWIVKYLVENTVGKTWLDLHPDSEVKAHLKYLVENDSGKPTLLEGVDEASKITLLDPAAGSGHILVTAFDLYMLMYKEEGLTTRQAAREILKDNLFGLDIDKRAAQLARFAVLMKAAGYDQGVLNENVLPHIYSMPEPVHFNREHLEKFLYEGYEGPTLDRDGILKDLNKGLLLMRQAQNLGSIIQFDLQDDTLKQLKLRYQSWCDSEEKGKLTLDELSWWKPLADYLNPLCVLLGKYTCVAANPPYMGQKNMNGELKDYVNKYYPESKADLFAVFMETCWALAINSCRVGMINQHSWMFLSSFEKLRQKILIQDKIESMLHLGPRLFEELSGEVVQSTAFVLKKNATHNEGNTANYYRLTDYRSSVEKQNAFEKQENLFRNIPQAQFFKIPQSPIAYWVSVQTLGVFESSKTIEDLFTIKQGLATCNNDLFIRQWSEVSRHNIGFNLTSKEAASSLFKWFPYNKGGGFRKWYGLNQYVVNWHKGGKDIHEYNKIPLTFSGAPVRAKQYYFNEGLTYNLISSGGSFASRYIEKGFVFDVGGSMIFNNGHTDEMLQNLFALTNTKVSSYFLNIINPTFNYQVGDVGKIPFRNYKAKMDIGDVLEIAKLDWNSRELSWDFKHSPLLNGSCNLKVSFDKWHKLIDDSFFKLHAQEEKLNDQFISLYGLSNEISSQIPLKDITILQDELDYGRLEQLQAPFVGQLVPIKNDVIMQQFISYVLGLLMGRYRLDKLGLNIAHPDPTNEELASYPYNGHHFVIDEDAIIPLVGEDSPFAHNVVRRFKDVMVAVWGEDTLTENINFLNECLGMSYEKFLVEKFWDYHKKVYQKKPIYWLFSSSAGSFKVLVYMHRMDKFTVQKIRLNYLHKYTEYLGNELEKMKASSAANRTVDKLEKAIQDCREYDKILKPLADQQIVFDLDDGVTVNHAKFKPAVVPIK
jgi:hypothetical protein